jgi:isopenicillin N synthase-like dioxygenase
MSSEPSVRTYSASPIAAAAADRPDFHSVPMIDLTGMMSNDLEARTRVAAALRDACVNVGFFYISNHGVPQELVDGMFAIAARLFALPVDKKMQWHVKKSSTLLGYVAMRDENANPTVGKGDMHEAFDFVPEDAEVEGDLLAGDFRRAGNLWPEEVPDFHELATRYGIEMRLLARRMFAAFALALELPEDYFASLTSSPMALIRMLHYPTQPGPFSEETIGTGAHTDHECFTILCQDWVQALQVRNRGGEWIEAPPIRGTFVVNIGDLMARWTNGIFASTYHRVSNLSGHARYSLPCFIGPNSDALIEALPSCVSDERPAKFAPVKAGEYVSSLIYLGFSDNHAAIAMKAELKNPPPVAAP